MARLIKKNQFIWLTVAMIGMMVAGAFSNDIPNNLTLELIEYTSVVLLLLSLLSLRTDRSWGRGFVLIIGLMLVLAIVRGATEFQFFEYFYLFLLLVFLLAAAWLVGSQVLLTGKVDTNIIVGSIALYLLIGYIWSIFYTILLQFNPDALFGIDPGLWYESLPRTTYFSFVTLTTLGYGDISPNTPIAQVLVTLEAVTGMFYIGVIVASLIGGRRKET